MEVLSNFSVKINKDNVLRYMGYKGSDNISPVIETEVDKEIEIAQNLLEPRLIYEEYPIRVDENREEVYLPDDRVWKGHFVANYMKGCHAIVVIVSTVGSRLSFEIEAAFAQGNYLKAMALDAIADSAIDNINKQFWLRLVNRVKKEKKGITGMLSPGHSDWDVTQQKILFSLIDASAIGVSLTDSCLMIPIKSISGIYGIGDNIPVSKSSHNCDMCPIKNCFMREMG